MRLKSLLAIPGLLVALNVSAGKYEIKPANPYFEKFQPVKAPSDKTVLIRGDRLAICGDSITEQKMYSRIMETYLTVCVPQLEITVRQYGWSGEKAPGFLHRMTNDCLRFAPTVATTCYGMNDFEYRAFQDRIGEAYRKCSTEIDEAFKQRGVRVVEGSAGCVGKRPTWVGDTNATVEELNLSLCQMRNIGIEVAKQEHIGFADIFWPMLVDGFDARRKYGNDYAIAGNDGVHPGWAGHLVMAYAFLHSFKLDGNIGTFTIDLRSGKAKVSAGHTLVVSGPGTWVINSARYPFCIGEGDPAKSDNIRSGTMLVPFNQELNRLMLVVKHAQAESYKLTWGDQTKSFTRKQLSEGINLAEEFPVNPFSEAFKKVDEAVAAKQAFETKQIKQIFHGDEGKADMEKAAAQTEAERQPLADAIKAAFVPVTHTIKIETE